MILGLIQNIALLIALAVGIHLLARQFERQEALYRLAAGLLFGFVGVVGMMMPVEFEPGIFYDGRSIVLSLAGLFGGPFVALIAAGMCGAYRIYLGGAGVWAGTAVIIEASALGVALHYLRRRDERWVKPLPLWAFGVLVHLLMMALQLLIPVHGWLVVQEIGLIVVILFPVAFVLMAQVFLDAARRRKAEQALIESEEQYRSLAEGAEAILWEYDILIDQWTYVAPQVERIVGYRPDEWTNIEFWKSCLHEDDRDWAAHYCAECTERGEAHEFEYRFCAKDGRIVWLRDVVSVEMRDGSPVKLRGFMVDISRRKQAENERAATVELLRLLNHPNDLHTLMEEVIGLLRNWSGCEAVGIRLREGEDFPYYVVEGFPPAFIQAENSLCALDQAGELLRDSEGNPVIECMCGNVICGRVDPALPFFTEGGSFWTNSTTDLLATASEEERQSRTRNRCNGRGYESVALVPLRHGNETLGLLQFNDSRRARFNLSDIMTSERLASNLAIGLVQRMTAERLRKSEEKYRELVEHARTIVLQWNTAGEITFLNTYGQMLLGYSEEQVIGRNVVGTIVPETESTGRDLAQMIDGICRNPEAYTDNDNENMTRDGRRLWVRWSNRSIVDGNGQMVGILSIGNDITQRKQAEEALRRTNEKLDSILRYCPLLITESSLDGRYILVNQAVCNAFGGSESELLGKPIHELLPTEVADTFMQRIERIRETQTPILVEDTLTISNEERIFDTILFPLFDSERRVVSVAGIAQDITERKESEAEKERLEEQYRQSQKMEAIGQLTGGVAHDFNNILQVINASVELVMMDIEPEHPAQETLTVVAKAGDRAARLVQQLLLFSRRQIMQPKTLDLNEVVTDLFKMLRRVIGEHIRLEWLPGTRIGSIHADSGMLEQTLMNLCINARDAMPEGGVLTIETQNVRIDSEYCASHTWASPGQYVLLSVTDTGCGMDSETLDHVFEPFFTTKEVGQGTGLGLATVYGIVKQHDGMISAYSEVGKGTTFKIYLPLCERKAETVGTLIEGEAKGGSETILLAEDDSAVRKLAQSILERAGYTVFTAENGVKALALFREHEAGIDLVILDVVMPQMGGREAYDQMRSVRPELRALFSSGYSENAIHTDFMLKEGFTLLPKPYAPDALLRSVRLVLDHKMA